MNEFNQIDLTEAEENAMASKLGGGLIAVIFALVAIVAVV